MLLGGDVQGALEHHVFKQVGDSRIAGLVLGSDLHPHLQRHDRRAAVNQGQHGEPVAKRRALKRLDGILEGRSARNARSERGKEQERGNGPETGRRPSTPPCGLQHRGVR